MQLMAVTANSRRSLHIEECDSNQVVMKNIFYFVFLSCINYPLTAKYTTEKLTAT